MDLLRGRTTSEVWLLGTEHLARQRPREDFDVFLNIATPTVLSEQDATVLRLVDNFLVRRGGLSVETVAEGSMRKCGAVMRRELFRLVRDCRSPYRDTIAGRSSVGSRRGSACGFAAEDARRSCSTASAAFSRTAC